jgi:hypothetical protein
VLLAARVAKSLNFLAIVEAQLGQWRDILHGDEENCRETIIQVVTV